MPIMPETDPLLIRSPRFRTSRYPAFQSVAVTPPSTPPAEEEEGDDEDLGGQPQSYLGNVTTAQKGGGADANRNADSDVARQARELEAYRRGSADFTTGNLARAVTNAAGVLGPSAIAQTIAGTSLDTTTGLTSVGLQNFEGYAPPSATGAKIIQAGGTAQQARDFDRRIADANRSAVGDTRDRGDDRDARAAAAASERRGAGRADGVGVSAGGGNMRDARDAAEASARGGGGFGGGIGGGSGGGVRGGDGIGGGGGRTADGGRARYSQGGVVMNSAARPGFAQGGVVSRTPENTRSVRPTRPMPGPTDPGTRPTRVVRPTRPTPGPSDPGRSVTPVRVFPGDRDARRRGGNSIDTSREARLSGGGFARRYAEGGTVAVGTGGPGQAQIVDPRSIPDDGIVDNQPIMADEGEMVLQRAAAEALGPDVLALLNDPRTAAILGDLIRSITGAAPAQPAAAQPAAARGSRLALVRSA